MYSVSDQGGVSTCQRCDERPYLIPAFPGVARPALDGALLEVRLPVPPAAAAAAAEKITEA